MNAVQTFQSKAPGVMAQLIRDFPVLTPLDAAAIVGNCGHESAGLTILQEIKPTVPGSKGGYGWPQWTGPRRRAYEAYCKRNNLDPASDQANYAYLFIELKGIEGSEGGAIAKTVKAVGLENKVKAFEQAFLRAGVKHYPSRIQWAERALEAWRSAKPGIPIPNPTPTPKPNPAPSPAPEWGQPEKPGTTMAAVVVGVVVAIVAVIWFVFIKR